jgi:hypothetical protein
VVTIFGPDGLWDANFRPDGTEFRSQRRSGPQRISSQHSLGRDDRPSGRREHVEVCHYTVTPVVRNRTPYLPEMFSGATHLSQRAQFSCVTKTGSLWPAAPMATLDRDFTFTGDEIMTYMPARGPWFDTRKPHLVTLVRWQKGA